MSDCPKCGLPDEPWCSGPCEIDPDCPRIPGYRGFQAGMKRGAEIAKQTHENSDDLDMYNSGWDAACEEIEQAILKKFSLQGENASR